MKRVGDDGEAVVEFRDVFLDVLHRLLGVEDGAAALGRLDNKKRKGGVVNRGGYKNG